MSMRMYRRLTRLAALAVASLAALAVARMVGGVAGLVLLVGASVPLYVAVGPYQADVSLNDGLTEAERRRWRIALFLVPWSMAVYWHLHVRR